VKRATFSTYRVVAQSCPLQPTGKIGIEVSMKRIWLIGGIGLALLTACATPGRVPAPGGGSPQSAEELLFAAISRAVNLPGDAGLFEGLHLPRAEARDAKRGFAAPHRLRPCCAFGHNLSVGLAALPLPGVRLDNVLDPTGLGRHRYDAAVLGLANGVRRAFFSPERNGLVYTRRGGFVDLAHVRGYADWTVYLAHRVEALLPEGGSVRLPDEAGSRTLHVSAASPESLRRLGPRHLARAVARRVAWQLSLWHEVATWYGWSSVGVFPERVSAFSPEDLYSNALGIRIASALLLVGGAEARAQYEANMDGALAQVLDRLGAVSAECSRRAALLVDHLWWDSRRRLPRPDVVLERNFQTGPELVPWRVSLPDQGHAQDPEVPVTPVVLRAPNRLDERLDEGLDDTDVASLARLEIQPERGRARRALGARVNGRDLEDVVQRVREEAYRGGNG
jgi:hypothetical protein